MRLNKFIDISVLSILIILISGASVLSASDFTLVMIFSCFVLLMAIRKIKPNMFILYIFLWWSVVNLISYLYNRTPFSWNLFGGYVLWILIPYFGIKIIGHLFWEKFEKWIYFLTIASTLLYFGNILAPEMFRSLSSFFEPITNPVLREKATQATYWYGFLYTHSGNEIYRNFGFIWESGAFAMIMTIMIVHNWRIKGISLSRHVIAYIIGLITTFSTAGYLALLLFMIIIIINTFKYRRIWKGVGLTVLFLMLGAFIWKSDFMSPKIDSFLSDSRKEVVFHQGYRNKWEANRLLTFVLDWKQSVNLPSGYGIVPSRDLFNRSKEIVGVNGLGEVMTMWGLPGLIFSLYLVFRYCSVPSAKEIGHLNIYLMAGSILIVFFSNPIIRNPLFFIIIFSGIIDTRYLTQEIDKN